MKALLLESKAAGLQYRDVEPQALASDEVWVEIKAAAMNHRDVFITQGLYPGIQYPIILGSDGAGVYEGRPVIINPAMDWGGDQRAQSKAFHILGLPTHGTFAEQVAVRRDRIHPKPAHLDYLQTAALPLGGMTAYRALFTKGDCKPTDKVLISGIGGGVALFAFQFALAVGAEVYVTSSSEEKLKRAEKMGAAGGVNYKEEGWHKQLLQRSGGIDLIIDSAGGEGFAQFLKVANPGGRIVMYGGTQGKIQHLSPQLLFWKQLEIKGSTMATDAEFRAMLDFVETHRIEPVIDEVILLSEAQRGFEKMASGQQFGKIVFTTGS